MFVDIFSFQHNCHSMFYLFLYRSNQDGSCNIANICKQRCWLRWMTCYPAENLTLWFICARMSTDNILRLNQNRFTYPKLCGRSFILGRRVHGWVWIPGVHNKHIHSLTALSAWYILELVICHGEICLHNLTCMLQHIHTAQKHLLCQTHCSPTESITVYFKCVWLYLNHGFFDNMVMTCALKAGVGLPLESSPAEPLKVFTLGSECTAPFQELPLKYQSACITDVMFQPSSIACKCSSDNSRQPSPKLNTPNILMGYWSPPPQSVVAEAVSGLNGSLVRILVF